MNACTQRGLETRSHAWQHTRSNHYANVTSLPPTPIGKVQLGAVTVLIVIKTVIIVPKLMFTHTGLIPFSRRKRMGAMVWA